MGVRWGAVERRRRAGAVEEASYGRGGEAWRGSGGTLTMRGRGGRFLEFLSSCVAGPGVVEVRRAANGMIAPVGMLAIRALPSTAYDKAVASTVANTVFSESRREPG